MDAAPMTDPRCEYSDLLRSSCAHCAGSTVPVTTVATLERLVGHALDQYRARPRRQPVHAAGEHGGQASISWVVDQPTPVWCDHPTTKGICEGCATMLWNTLADVPNLIQELQTAVVKDVRFVERGTAVSQLDEAPIEWNDPAANTLGRLAAALLYPDGVAASQWGPARAARWMQGIWTNVLIRDDVREVCGQVTAAAARGRGVIDRPRDLVFVGICPACDSEGRSTRLIVDRDTDPIICPHPECSYTEDRRLHEQAMIDAGADQMLTLDELVGAVTRSDKVVVSRAQILRWIDRGGLPRERVNRPRWNSEGALIDHPVWVYRLGDVIDRATEDQGVTLREVARLLQVSERTVFRWVQQGTLEPVRPGAKPLRFHTSAVDRLIHTRPAS